jgi:hypothetical protein
VRFWILCGYAEDDETWEEDYNRPEVKSLEEAGAYGAKLVQSFNDTLRPGEKIRKYINARLDESAPDFPDHDFEKQNLVTIFDPRRGMHDLLKCRNCPVFGRRYGLIGFQIDRKFRAAKWSKCRGVQP